MAGRKNSIGKPESLIPAVKGKMRECNMCRKVFFSTGLHSCPDCSEFKNSQRYSKREAGGYSMCGRTGGRDVRGST